jgi:hypothetical protein
MFSAKALTVFSGALVVAGLATACGDTGEGTPTDTPTETPVAETQEPMSYTTDDVSVLCSGTDADSVWDFYLDVLGAASEEDGLKPSVTLFDNSDYGYGGDTSAVWSEYFTLNLSNSDVNLDGSIIYAQNWDRNVADKVGSFNDQVEDVNTIFQCQNREALTYVFCAYDAFSYDEICVGVGPEADAQCQAFNCLATDPNGL